jgi:hypothetical protein
MAAADSGEKRGRKNGKICGRGMTASEKRGWKTRNLRQGHDRQ